MIDPADGVNRCTWAHGDPLMQAYHDREWGVVERDGQALWAKLTLDGFQAGLSWRTILWKREAFRKAFAGFDPHKVARFGARDVKRLLGNAEIIRSKAKINAAISNARIYLEMEDAGEDFSDFLWGNIGGIPIQRDHKSIPAQTPESERLSKELKARGFSFVGPVIVYAFMQAVGMTNDHTRECFRWKELKEVGARRARR